jgi:phage gpG-like protein
MDINDLEKKITQDLAVELADEFDRNFERKAFFTEKWASPKINNSRGSVMNRSGNLRRSIKYNVRDGMILFSSSLPYASIHNEGGEITVTAQMKKYFWAMYYKADGATTFKRDKEKNVVARDTVRNKKLTSEAAKWKGLALMKIGQKIKVEKRQMVGDHPQVAKIVKEVIDINMELFNQELIKKLNR